MLANARPVPPLHIFLKIICLKLGDITNQGASLPSNLFGVCWHFVTGVGLHLVVLGDLSELYSIHVHVD